MNLCVYNMLLNCLKKGGNDFIERKEIMFLGSTTANGRSPIANSADRIEAEGLGTGVHPAGNGLRVTLTGALDKLAAILGIGEIAHVVAVDPAVFVNLHHISGAVLADGRRLLDHLRGPIDIVLIRIALRHDFLTELFHWTDDGRRDGDDDGSPRGWLSCGGRRNFSRGRRCCRSSGR